MNVAEILQANRTDLHDWAWVEANVTRERGVKRDGWASGRSVIRGGMPLFDQNDGMRPIYRGFDFVNRSSAMGPLRMVGWKPKDEDKAATDWCWADPG